MLRWSAPWPALSAASFFLAFFACRNDRVTLRELCRRSSRKSPGSACRSPPAPATAIPRSCFIITMHLDEIALLAVLLCVTAGAASRSSAKRSAARHTARIRAEATAALTLLAEIRFERVSSCGRFVCGFVRVCNVAHGIAATCAKLYDALARSAAFDENFAPCTGARFAQLWPCRRRRLV